MALNKNTTFNPDDMSFMDPGMSSSDRSSLSKAMKFIFKPIKGMAKAAFKDLTKDMDNLDDAMLSASDFTDAAREAIGGLKDSANGIIDQVKEIGRNNIDYASPFLPKFLSRRMKRMFENQEAYDSYGSDPDSEMRSTITSIFGKMAAQQAENTNLMMKSAAADRAMNSAYLKVNANALSHISDSVSSVNYFLNNVYTRYLEKDIELKYRSLHITSEIKSYIDEVATAFRKEGLMHQIAESVSMSDNEKIVARRKIDSSRSGVTQYRNNLPKDFVNSLAAIPGNFMEKISTSLMMNSGMDGLEAIGAFLGKKFSSKIPKPLMDLFNKAKKATGIVNGDLGYLFKNFPLLFNSAKDEFGLFPKFERKTTRSNQAVKDPTGPAVFDNLTRETIISTIPDHLGRINNTLDAIAKSMGTGPVSPDNDMVYDMSSRKLIKKSEQKQKMRDFVYGDEITRKERADKSVKIILNNLTQLGADRDDIQLMNSVSEEIQTFFNRSAEFMLNLDPIALQDYVKNGTKASDKTITYVKKIFGKLTDKTKIAATVILKSVTTSDKYGSYYSNALRKSIANHITDLGHDMDKMESRREQLEDRNLFDMDEYDVDDEGSTTVKSGARLVNMRGKANVFKTSDGSFDESVAERMQFVENQRKKFFKNKDRNFITNMSEKTGLDTPHFFTKLAPGWMREAAYHIRKFGKKTGATDFLKGVMSSNSLGSWFNDFLGDIVAPTILRIIPQEGTVSANKVYKFKVVIRDGIDLQKLDVVITGKQLDLKKMTVGNDGQPSKELKDLVDLIKKELKNDDLVAEYAPELFSDVPIISDLESTEEDAYKASISGGNLSGSVSSVKSGLKTPKITSNKSALEIIQEDVRALREKFVGKVEEPKEEVEEKPETPKRPTYSYEEPKLSLEGYDHIHPTEPGRHDFNDEVQNLRGERVSIKDYGNYLWQRGKATAKNLWDRKGEIASAAWDKTKGIAGAAWEKAKGIPGVGKVLGFAGGVAGGFLGALGMGVLGLFNFFKRKRVNEKDIAKEAMRKGIDPGTATMIGLLSKIKQSTEETTQAVKEGEGKEGGGLGDTIENLSNMKDGLSNMMPNIKKLRRSKLLRTAAKLDPKRLLTRSLPRTLTKAKPLLQGAMQYMPGAGTAGGLLASLGAAAALGGMGFGGSRSSGAGKASTAFSTTTGALAGLLAFNPATAPIAAGLGLAMAGNAMREGWNDKATQKKSWNSELAATDDQKGASAAGNLLNYASFGLLNKLGGRKYVDKFLDTTGLAGGVAGLGGMIGGVGDLFKSSKRAELGNSAPMTELEVKRARAKLQTDIKRGVPDAQQKLGQFEEAVKAKDWHTARTISGVVVNESRETSDAWKRVGMGALKYTAMAINPVAGIAMSHILSANDQTRPMTPEELKEAEKRFAARIKRDPSAKSAYLDFQEAVAGERWAVARKLSGVEYMNALNKKFGKNATWSAYATLGLSLLFLNNENEPMTKQEIAKFQNECKKILDQNPNNTHIKQLLENFNEAVETGNWKVARKLSGKETKSILSKLWSNKRTTMAIMGAANILNPVGQAMLIASAFMTDQNTPMAQKDIEAFRKKMIYRKENGDPEAQAILDRFDEAVLTNKWAIARKISGIEHTSVAHKVGTFAVDWLFWGDDTKPMTQAEIDKFRASMQRKIENGDMGASKILQKFDDAVGNQKWKIAREISNIKQTSLLGLTGKVALQSLKDITGYSLFFDSESALSETDVTKFRERMRKLIDQGNPTAKQMLSEFNDAVEDGNWKKARKIMGKKDLGHIGNFLRWMRSDSTVVEIGEKDKSNTKTAKRYRFILAKVKEALTKKNLKPYYGVLIDIRDDMQKLDYLELDDETLSKFENRLKAVDRSAGLFDEESIETYDAEHQAKMKIIERKQALLSEISAAQGRCGLFERSKRNELKRLFNEVDLLTLEELDDDILNTYDEELRLIDKQAISTKQYSPEEQKKLTQSLKRSTSLLSEIERSRDKLHWYDFSKRRALTKLQDDIESTLPEERTEDMFNDWDAMLREIDPSAASSVQYSSEELKAMRKKVTKRDLLKEAIQKYNKTLSWVNPKNWSRKRALSRLVNEMETTPDEEISDEMISDWENTYKEEAGEEAKTADELLKEDSEHKEALKTAKDLRATMRNTARKMQLKHDDKLAAKVQGLIDKIDATGDEDKSKAFVTRIKKDFHDLVKGTNYEASAKATEEAQAGYNEQAKATIAAAKAKPGTGEATRVVESVDTGMGTGPTTFTRGGAVVGSLSLDSRLRNNSPIQQVQAAASISGATTAPTVKASTQDTQADKMPKVKIDASDMNGSRLYSIDGQEWFPASDLHRRSVTEQLLVLHTEILTASMNAGSDFEAETKLEADLDKLDDMVIEAYESGSASMNDIAKFENMAAKLGVKPYCNAALYGLELLVYDAAEDPKASETSRKFNLDIVSGMKNNFKWLGGKAFNKLKGIGKSMLSGAKRIGKAYLRTLAKVYDPFGIGRKALKTIGSGLRKGISFVKGLFGKKDSGQSSGEGQVPTDEIEKNKYNFYHHSSEKQGVFTLPDGTEFTLHSLRQQTPYNQLLYLRLKVLSERSKYSRSEEKWKALNEFVNSVDAQLSTGKATLKDVASFEEIAKQFHIFPYNTTLIEPISPEDIENEKQSSTGKPEEQKTGFLSRFIDKVKNSFSTAKDKIKGGIKGFLNKLKNPGKVGILAMGATGMLPGYLAGKAIGKGIKAVKSVFSKLFGKKKEEEQNNSQSSESSAPATNAASMQVMGRHYNWFIVATQRWISIRELRQASTFEQLCMLKWFVEWYLNMNRDENGMDDGEIKQALGDCYKKEDNNPEEYDRVWDYENEYETLGQDKVDLFKTLLADIEKFGKVVGTPEKLKSQDPADLSELAKLEFRAYLLKVVPYCFIYDDKFASRMYTRIDPLPITLGEMQQATEDLYKKQEEAKEKEMAKKAPKKSLAGKLKDKAKAAFSKLKNGIKSTIAALKDRAKAVANKAKDKLKSGLGKIKGFFSGAKDTVVSAAEKMGNGVKDFAAPITNAGMDLLRPYTGKLSDKYHDVMNYVKDKAGDIQDSFGGGGASLHWNSITDNISTNVSSAKDFAKNTLSKVQVETNDLMKNLIASDQQGTGEICNSLSVNANMLNAIFNRLGDVVDAVSEHNTKINKNINSSVQQSYEFMKTYTNSKLDSLKVKQVAPIFKPPVISIAKA